MRERTNTDCLFDNYQYRNMGTMEGPSLPSGLGTFYGETADESSASDTMANHFDDHRSSFRLHCRSGGMVAAAEALEEEASAVYSLKSTAPTTVQTRKRTAKGWTCLSTSTRSSALMPHARRGR
uniref:Uncharacterized protein n=1 Tax=Pseudictyota dubia TaxID=2749911 RepID=A0A7R9ZFM4_9STRA|mmetsp:Transcript_50761/g.93861  ORF Transcript_50761/g.93861 Transcript_50761/m.93861 type:complete len:124 (+) Transcript_50761:124-495(+)